MDYKDTLLMPDTKFKMKAGLAVKEPLIQKEWKDLDIYNKRLKQNEKKEVFYLHDGPPYANGNLHVGHALNKILKDMIIRFKNMNGFYAPFVCGWDTHGLPIEQMVTKKGIDRKKTPVIKFREECEKYALDQIDMQIEQFNRLSIFTDYSKKYVTLKPWYESRQLEVFYKMFENGSVFKGLKPVYWSWSSESALAEAEIEYREKRSPSIYVAMKIVDGPLKDHYPVIWTTTPWTIPANQAIVVGAKIEYSIVVIKDKKYIVASNLVKEFVSENVMDAKDHKIEKTLTGNDLINNKYEHPLNKKVNPIILGNHATDESGTGLVHTAPGHGEDDFIVGQQNNLETVCVVDGKGVMSEEAGKYCGQFYEDANKNIGMDLEECGALLKLAFIKHSYPHDWRTKKPVFFRATDQWFVTLKDNKDKILKFINKDIKWANDWAKVRMNNMIENRGDWCISRQRIWGVPIPLFYDEKGNVLNDPEQNKHIVKLVEENGTNIWYKLDTDKLLLPKHQGKGFTKELDIMDVWFDSGSSYYAISEQFNLPTQADLYLEGSDQFRGWFNSSLITSVSAFNAPAYKGVLSHGFVLDGKGMKMSKSLGNVIDPIKVCKSSGADILRMWVMSANYSADVRVSDEIINQAGESYRKIRNSFKFALGNLSDFDDKKLVKEFKDPANKYMINKINEIITSSIDHYNKYEFNTILTNITNFITNDLSAFYFDFAKDVLYCDQKDGIDRVEMQTVIYHVFTSLLKLLAPVIPYTTEEAYKMLECLSNKKESIHLEDMPTPVAVKDGWKDSKEFFELKENAYKLIEDLRNEKIIGKSLEVKLIVPTEYQKFTKELLEKYLIVSQVEFGSELKAQKAEGTKCPRCWKIHNDSEELCSRCASVKN